MDTRLCADLAVAVVLVACGARTELRGSGEAPDASSVIEDVTIDAPPPPDFLWFKLDETSGDVAHDSSPNHKDVALSNVKWAQGAVFDQTCGEVDVGASYRAAPVTITAWLTPASRGDETSNTYALAPYPPNAISGDVPSLGGFGIGLDAWTDGSSGAALAIETGVDAPIAFHSLDGAFASGTRYFVALVVEATSATVYVDGAPMKSVTADTPPPTSPVPLHLGCHNDDAGYGSKRFFAGTMRDVRVYRRSIGASEIAQLFANGPV